MSTAIDAFLPYILPGLHSVPQPLVEQYIIETCIDFSKRTLLDQTIVPTNCTATVQDYALTLPTDKAFCAILGVMWQGTWLPNVPPDDVKSDVALTGTTIGTAVPTAGSPRFYFQKTTDLATVSLYPVPDITLALGLTFKVAWQPTQTAATVADQFFNDWVEGISFGVKARLKSISGQPWSDEPGPDRTMYERAVQAAKRQKVFGKLPNGSRIMPQSFMGGGAGRYGSNNPRTF